MKDYFSIIEIKTHLHSNQWESWMEVKEPREAVLTWNEIDQVYKAYFEVDFILIWRHEEQGEGMFSTQW